MKKAIYWGALIGASVQLSVSALLYGSGVGLGVATIGGTLLGAATFVAWAVSS